MKCLVGFNFKATLASFLAPEVGRLIISAEMWDLNEQLPCKPFCRRDLGQGMSLTRMRDLRWDLGNPLDLAAHSSAKAFLRFAMTLDGHLKGVT